MNEGPPLTARRVIWQNAKLVRRVPRTASITSFFFSLSEPFNFKAGQHVDVRLTAADGYHAIRSYSIASAPAKGAVNEIELAIEKLSGGEVSLFFHDEAQVDDVIELKGPLGGHFVWPADQAAPILLVGGGSGLVPLISMIRHRATVGSSVPLALLLSARSWDEVLFRDELYTLAAKQDGFTFDLTLTRDSGLHGGVFTGRINPKVVRAVTERLPSLPNAVFVCGTNEFVNTSTTAIQALKIPASAIKTERYGGL